MAFLIPLAISAATAIGSTVGATAAAGTAAAAAGTAATGFSLGSALSLGSTLLGAVGALSQANAASNAASYNAEIQRQQANTELDQAGAKATDAATRTRQRVAATRAGAIQNGFEVDGSVTDLLDTVQKQGGLEELTALYDGTQRARGLRASASLNESNASNALTAGYFNVGTSLLTGASRAYGYGPRDYGAR